MAHFARANLSLQAIYRRPGCYSRGLIQVDNSKQGIHLRDLENWRDRTGHNDHACWTLYIGRETENHGTIPQ
jgi:hypothetical protein